MSKLRISKPPAERRREILEAALSVFSEKGYEEATIQDIASRAGVAQGLCYRYFTSKQEIFSAAADLYAEQSVKNLEIAENQPGSPVIILSAILAKLLRHTVLRGQFEAGRKNEEGLNAVRLHKMGEKLVERIVPIVEEGRARGIFKCENVNIASVVLVFGVVHLLHYKVPPENTRNYILAHKKNIIQFCEQVLAVSPGYKIGIGWDLYLT